MQDRHDPTPYGVSCTFRINRCRFLQDPVRFIELPPPDEMSSEPSMPGVIAWIAFDILQKRLIALVEETEIGVGDGNMRISA